MRLFACCCSSSDRRDRVGGLDSSTLRRCNIVLDGNTATDKPHQYPVPSSSVSGRTRSVRLAFNPPPSTSFLHSNLVHMQESTAQRVAVKLLLTLLEPHLACSDVGVESVSIAADMHAPTPTPTAPLPPSSPGHTLVSGIQHTSHTTIRPTAIRSSGSLTWCDTPNSDSTMLSDVPTMRSRCCDL